MLRRFVRHGKILAIIGLCILFLTFFLILEHPSLQHRLNHTPSLKAKNEQTPSPNANQPNNNITPKTKTKQQNDISSSTKPQTSTKSEHLVTKYKYDSKYQVEEPTKKMEKMSIVHENHENKGKIVINEPIIRQTSKIQQQTPNNKSTTNKHEVEEHKEKEPLVPTGELDWEVLIGDIVGGLALFMYGMKMMTSALKTCAGDRMKDVLAVVSSNQLLGLVTGVVITALLQSSALVTIMLVGFVSSGYMNFRHSIIVLLGSGIGTTITSQLVAFNIGKYSLFIVCGGIIMISFSKRKFLGSGILGIGLIFFGLGLMSKAMLPLRTYPPFIQALIALSHFPILAIIVSLILTAIVQSSTAIVGIVIVLATQQLITLEAGVSFVLGANVGTAISGVWAAIGTTREAQRVATANVLLKLFGVVLIIPLMQLFMALIKSSSRDLPRQIANAHTMYNVGVAVLFFPFTRQLAFLVTKVLPDPVYHEKTTEL